MLYKDSIVIRSADKGSGIVVIYKDIYTQSLQQEIEQSNSYAETEMYLTKESHKKVQKVVNKKVRNGTATKEMQQYLVPKYVQTGTLKGNPKIHKANVPFRTIVSGIYTHTEKIADLAMHELRTL